MGIVTISQATAMWCPYSRDGATAAPCLADRCMAWRAVQTEAGESKIEGIRRRREETGCTLIEAKEFVETHAAYLRRPASDAGYCGLAGVPE